MPQSNAADGELLNNGLCFVLQRANLVISRRLDNALRPVGLTSRQLIILSAIDELGALRQTALADVLGKDHTTLTVNLRLLKKRGLVVSAVDADDQRARMVSLTPDGDLLLDRARGPLRRFNAELCAQIQREGDTRDLRAILETLSQVQRAGELLSDRPD